MGLQKPPTYTSAMPADMLAGWTTAHSIHLVHQEQLSCLARLCFADLGANANLQAMKPAAITHSLAKKVSSTLTSKFQRAGVSLFWACRGTNTILCLQNETFNVHAKAKYAFCALNAVMAAIHAGPGWPANPDMVVGDRLRFEKKHKKATHW